MDLLSPGYPWAKVLAELPPAVLARLLGERLVGLVRLLAQGADLDRTLRTVASTTLDPEQVLADPESRSSLLAALPGLKSVELSRRLGAPVGEVESFLDGIAWTAAQRRAAGEFFGQVVDDRKARVVATTEAAPRYGLFEHQRAAAARVRSLLYTSARRVVLHLPTGVGKTRTAMNIICRHLRESEPCVVVWLAHGSELLEQAALEFEKAWEHLGDRQVEVQRLWANADVENGGIRDGIVIFGLEKATALQKAGAPALEQIAARSSLVVFDEAHQAVAPTYRAIVDRLTLDPRTSLLGLTATPGRTWADISADKELADYFERQKVMLEIEGHTNPVSALIEQGYLSRPSFRTVASTSGLHLSDEDRARLVRSFDIPGDILDKVADDEQWNMHVVETALQLSHEHRRILLFASSVRHARLIAGVLTWKGVEANAVTGETPLRTRERLIARFKAQQDSPMILCNYGVLTTGFDAPAASAAVISRPTKSLVLYSQMVGRVIRGPKAGGTPTCEIVTVVNPALPGFGDVADAFVNWEDVWGN